jgi:hypothetical protein
MNTLKLFGFTEHLFFYLIFVLILVFLFVRNDLIVYLAAASWVLSFLSHYAESKMEGKSSKKIIVGV